MIDPYYQKHNKEQNVLLDEAIRTADRILITHPHLDHFSSVKKLVDNGRAQISVAARGIEIAGGLGIDSEKFEVLHHHTVIKLEENGFIKAYRSRHVKFDRKLFRRTMERAFCPWNFHEGMEIRRENQIFSMTDDDIFAFEISDGKKTVFVMGSANLREDVDYPKGMDLLVYPYQGRSDIKEYSVPLIKRLDPVRTMLSHYDDAFPPVSSQVDTSDITAEMNNVEAAVFDQWVTV